MLTGRPGRAQTKTLRESRHKGQVDRCIFQVMRLRQVVGWLLAVVFVSFFRFDFLFAVAVPRLRKPSNAFPRRLCETPNKMHNTMCCTMCGVYRFLIFPRTSTSFFKRTRNAFLPQSCPGQQVPQRGLWPALLMPFESADWIHNLATW